VVQFWRKNLGGPAERSVRWQFHGQTISFDDNLAMLESSESDPLEILTTKSFIFRIANLPEPVDLEFADSDPVRYVTQQLSNEFRIRIKKLAGHPRRWFSYGLREFAPDDQMSQIDNSKEIQVSIQTDVEIQVFHRGGDRQLYRVPAQSTFSALYTQIGVERQLVNDAHMISRYSPVPSCGDSVYSVCRGVEMRFSVSVEGTPRDFTLHEDDRVLNLIHALSGGSWYLKCDGRLITNNFVYLCTFLFHTPPGRLFASRTAPSGILIPFIVNDVQFQWVSYDTHVTVADLNKLIYDHFLSVNAHHSIQICSSILSNPQQEIDLDPSCEFKVRFGSPVIQVIQLFIVSEMKSKAFTLPLTSTVDDLVEQLRGDYRFASAQEWFFTDRQRLISSYPLTPWPIEVWPSATDASRFDNMIPPYPDPIRTSSPGGKQSSSAIPTVVFHPSSSSSDADRETRISPKGGIPSVATIQCALILPPDDVLFKHDFERDATVADAIAVARRQLSGASALCRETRLSDQPEPRDLFVTNCVVCEIRQRTGDGFGGFEKEVFDDSTVGELLVWVEERLGQCKLANDSGEIQSADVKISYSNHSFGAVPPGSECVIGLHLAGRELNGLEIDGEATVGMLVECQCSVFGVRERISCVRDDRGPVNAEQKLKTVEGVLWIDSKPDGLQDSTVPIAPLSSISDVDSGSSVSVSPISGSGCSTGSVSDSDCPTYLFQNEDNEFTLPIPASWTVFETKEKVADRYETKAEYVSLLFSGRNMKDATLLIHQRIGAKPIIVYIRRFDTILLESVGYGSRRGAGKPSDFIERVNRLENETGQDRRTCSRCLMFYDYDVDRAREALQMIA
jgi:hypothetical protein